MRKVFQCLLGASCFLSGTAFAAQADIVGESRVSAAADYVELEITVQSQCFKSPAAARDATDDSAQKLVAFIKANFADGNTEVFTNGGYTTIYEPYGRTQSEEVCKGTFQKTSKIALNTTNVEGFSQMFDRLQDKVYAEYGRTALSESELPSVSFATLGQPRPGFFHATREELEQKALHLALENAEDKLEKAFGSCVLGKYQIVSVSEFSSMHSSDSYAEKGTAPRMGGPEAPVHFDNRWVKKSVRVKFEIFAFTPCEDSDDAFGGNPPVEMPAIPEDGRMISIE